MIEQSVRAPMAPGDAALRGMFAARKQVFIDQLKWDLPVLDGRFELDQFDTPDARYLILLDPDDLRHRASARLLPTTAPHLLGDIYPHLCADGPPTGTRMWEISRFCLDLAQTPAERRDARNQARDRARRPCPAQWHQRLCRDCGGGLVPQYQQIRLDVPHAGARLPR